jgi:hypothetical protein
VEEGVWGGLVEQDESIEHVRRAINIRLYFEGISDWTTREYIEIIDDYLMERLPVMLNNALEPYGLEASVLENTSECTLGYSPCEENTLIVKIYPKGSHKPLFIAVYRRRVGENTYEFSLKKFLNA